MQNAIAMLKKFFFIILEFLVCKYLLFIAFYFYPIIDVIIIIWIKAHSSGWVGSEEVGMNNLVLVCLTFQQQVSEGNDFAFGICHLYGNRDVCIAIRYEYVVQAYTQILRFSCGNRNGLVVRDIS